jgi:hypothetical protein
MHIYEKQDFYLAMESLRSAFQITDHRFNQLLETYFTYLQDVDLIRMTKAIRLAVLQLDAFPTINKLRSLAGAHDTDENCEICHSAKVVERERHIRTLAEHLYQGECLGDATWTCERVYAHARASYHEHPEILKWVEESLKKLIRCSPQYQADGLVIRARELSRRAPWLLDTVLEALGAHRDYWQGRVADMEKVAREADEAFLQTVGLASIHQILRHGEQTLARITRQMSEAVIHQTGKPRSDTWQTELVKEGIEKLELMRARFEL